MKTTDFTYLLNNPEAITGEQTADLERVLTEFPYFQSAAAIRLKGLYKRNDFRYNSELKKIASQTTSRTILYDLVTAENFFNNKDLYEIEVVDPEIIFATSISTENKTEQSILFSIEASEIKNIEPRKDSFPPQDEFEHPILFSIETDQIKTIYHTKEIPPKQSQSKEQNKPIEISDSDKFSFTQWLQLTQKQPILITYKTEKKSEIISEKQKKNTIIDKFIETNPKIIPHQNISTKPVLDEKNAKNSTLMTETLAQVYLKQKKYQKAIEAYEILILKYPKKSSFFADKINDIKKIQQNNI